MSNSTSQAELVFLTFSTVADADAHLARLRGSREQLRDLGIDLLGVNAVTVDAILPIGAVGKDEHGLSDEASTRHRTEPDDLRD